MVIIIITFQVITTPVSNLPDKKKKLSYSSGKKSSFNRRKSSSDFKPPDASPHLVYHMTAATNGQHLKPVDLNALVNSSFQNSPEFKSPEPTKNPKSIIGESLFHDVYFSVVKLLWTIYQQSVRYSFSLMLFKSVHNTRLLRCCTVTLFLMVKVHKFKHYFMYC